MASDASPYTFKTTVQMDEDSEMGGCEPVAQPAFNTIMPDSFPQNAEPSPFTTGTSSPGVWPPPFKPFMLSSQPPTFVPGTFTFVPPPKPWPPVAPTPSQAHSVNVPPARAHPVSVPPADSHPADVLPAHGHPVDVPPAYTRPINRPRSHAKSRHPPPYSFSNSTEADREPPRDRPYQSHYARGPQEIPTPPNPEKNQKSPKRGGPAGMDGGRRDRWKATQHHKYRQHTPEEETGYQRHFREQQEAATAAAAEQARMRPDTDEEQRLRRAEREWWVARRAAEEQREVEKQKEKEKQRERQRERERERQRMRQKEREKQKKAEENRRRQQDAASQRQRNVTVAANDDFNRTLAWFNNAMMVWHQRGTWTSFPLPPLLICAACRLDRNYQAFPLCRHKFKLFIDRLFAGDMPGKLALLKDARKKWHPDRFGVCSENVRGEVKARAEEMFKILAHALESA